MANEQVLRFATKLHLQAQLVAHVAGETRGETAQAKERVRARDGGLAIRHLSGEGLAAGRAALHEAKARRPRKKGGRPAKEAVDLLVAGPPAYGTPDAWPRKREHAWADAADVALRRLVGPNSKIITHDQHRDERSPHTQSHVVPIASDGRLGWCAVRDEACVWMRREVRELRAQAEAELQRRREAGEELPDLPPPSTKSRYGVIQDWWYYTVSRPFGLERGIVGSKATHQAVDVQKSLDMAAEVAEGRAESARRTEGIWVSTGAAGREATIAGLQAINDRDEALRERDAAVRERDEALLAADSARAAATAAGEERDAARREVRALSVLQLLIAEHRTAEAAAREARQVAENEVRALSGRAASLRDESTAARRSYVRAWRLIRRFIAASRDTRARIRADVEALASRRSDLIRNVGELQKRETAAAKTVKRLKTQVEDHKAKITQAKTDFNRARERVDDLDTLVLDRLLFERAFNEERDAHARTRANLAAATARADRAVAVDQRQRDDEVPADEALRRRDALAALGLAPDSERQRPAPAVAPSPGL